MDKFFSIFGKVVLVLLIVGSILYGGYYFGTQAQNTQKPKAVAIENEDIDEENTDIETPPSETEAQVTIAAGVSKSAGLSFDQYTITTGESWTSKKESQSALDEKLTISKEGYSITIFQAATGGAICLYPGDADFEGPNSKYETFKVLTTKDGKTLRRSGNKNGTAFTICQRSADDSYQQPTNYGHISVTLPAIWDYTVLNEIDEILSSLKKTI
jgi:hypothetical protein